MTNQTPIIKLNPKRILIFLFALIAALVGLSIWGQRVKYFGVADIKGAWHEFFLDLLMQAFYLDYEGNVPTYTNALMLFVISQLLAGIGLWKYFLRDKFRFHWLALALIFLLLSYDEAAVLHEQLIKPMRAIMGAEGVFYFAWIVPGIVAVALFAVIFLLFFLHLETKFKILFFLSLAVYIGGVIGGEMVSGYYAANLGLKNFKYAIVASIEESIEMIGCALIIYSLLEYIKHNIEKGLTLQA